MKNIKKKDRYNILFILTDQERENTWIPDYIKLPGREMLKSIGLEFKNHYTHTSPCSPSRASIFTGKYIHQHGVTENSSSPKNTHLSFDELTIGKVLRREGYYTAYKGKWHLQYGPQPDMDKFGFGDWRGNDMSFWGLPNSGTEYDPIITENTIEWLTNHAQDVNPWFLCVGLVNPHDGMWFPVDQMWYWEENPQYTNITKSYLEKREWGRNNNLPGFSENIPEYINKLPINFYDDLDTKPSVHQVWMKMMLKHSRPGIINPEDERLWLMQLNYYLQLHILNDLCLQKILFTLDQKDLWKNTVIIFTSDHGDQCGSHKLRSKGPWNYQETMNVPLYIVSPEWNGPRETNNLTSHIDLAPTIFNLAGSNKKFEYKFEGKNLIDILDNPSVPIREYVYFAQEWPWYPGVEKVRYASSGFFDGRFKYARYYGVGCGVTNMGLEMTGKMEIKRNAPFDLVEHELYDLQEDPFELNNLGQTKSSKVSLTKKQFQRLYEIENKIGI